MKKFLTSVLSMTLLVLLWAGEATYAHVGVSQVGGLHAQHANSVPTNTHDSSHAHANRCTEGTGQASQQIPKPEHRKFHEGNGRKVGKRHKRKRSRRSTKNKSTKRKRAPAPGMKGANTLQSAKRRVRKKAWKLRSERIDDIPLLIGVMAQIGYVKIIDTHIRAHGNQRALTWGWTAVIWLAYILSEGDHRKVAVRGYVRGMKHTLAQITGQAIDELDFTDDRLGILLKHFSQREWWVKIEHDISVDSIEVYELPQDTVRCDATTASGYHGVTEDGLFQFGHSKDDAQRPQIKIMTGSLDPLGMPLATDVVSGEHADDGLYIPVITRINAVLQRPGVLYVGDCKLSAFENRLTVKGCEGHYLCPLPQTGETAQKMDEWIEAGLALDAHDELIRYSVVDAKGQDQLKAKGYEIERTQSGRINGHEKAWTERVLIVYSPAYASVKEHGLERRLKNAEEKISALTPARGRGKRQMTDESQVIAAANAVLEKHRVENFLTYDYDKEVERETRYVGKGRGSAKRARKTIEKIRYHITNVSRNEDTITDEVKTYGWKVYATDVSRTQLSFVDVMVCYRKEYRVERIFARLKSRLNISPFFVKRDDQVKGLTHLLTLGVRVFTVIEYVVRRSLHHDHKKLAGLHPENPKKLTDIPTTERLLKAFSTITLTIIETEDRVIGHLTPLSHVQLDILERVGLSATTYTVLEIGQSADVLNE